MKLLNKQIEELKKCIILNENAYDDDLEDTYEYLIEAAKQLHGTLEKLIEKQGA